MRPSGTQASSKQLAERRRFGEWLDHWLDNIAARKVRARTLGSRRRAPPARPAPAGHLERLYAALAVKGLSPASVLRAHRVLSRALRVATQRGRVAQKVATLVDPPAVKRPETALPLSAEEARKVMATAQAHRNAALTDDQFSAVSWIAITMNAFGTLGYAARSS